MAPQRAGAYIGKQCAVADFREGREREQPPGCVMRKSLREFEETSRPSLLAQTSGIANSGLQYPESGLAAAIANIMAALLLMMSVVAGGRAIAGEPPELLEQMVPQRPGMKSEEDYQRFEQEHGLPQSSEPTSKHMDRLRAESSKELRLQEEYARRRSSNLSALTDEEILNGIRRKTEVSGDPPSVDAREDWPKSPEEFEKKYGRPPQRREEVDFYFDTDDDDTDEEGASR